METKEYFADNYDIARTKFCNIVKQKNGQFHQLTFPLLAQNSTPLTMDIAWFGSEKPQNVIIHSCGLHGPEGFCGSAIQIKTIGDLPVLDENIALIFIHALNPYGMDNIRRANENNVDLNRNYRPDNGWNGVSATYKALYAFLNPTQKSNIYLDAARLIGKITRLGRAKVRREIGQGQYEYPEGLFFGGKELQTSYILLEKWLQQNIMGIEQVIAIDIHTGLGKFAEECFPTYDGGDFFHDKLKKRIGGKFVGKNDVGYYPDGAYSKLIQTVFAKAKVHNLIQEFGTLDQLKLFNALRQEQREYNADSVIKESTKKTLLEAFSPANKKWQRIVIDKGFSLICEVVESLKE